MGKIKSGAGRWMLIIIGTVVVLSAMMIMWISRAGRMPDISIPAMKMPSPNAYDYYLRAGNRIVDGQTIVYAAYNIGAPPLPKGTPADPNRPYSPAEIIALVNRNSSALKTLREGFKYPFMNPFTPASAYQPTWSTYRTLGQLLILEGQAAEHRGDFKKAVTCYIDVIRICVDLERGGGVMHMQTSRGVQSLGRWRVWEVVESLDSRASKEAAGYLADVIARQVPLHNILENEKWSTVASLMEDFKQPNWYSGYEDHVLPKFVPESVNDIALRFRSNTYSKSSLMSWYLDYMDKAGTYAQSRYAAKRPEPPIPSDLVKEKLTLPQGILLFEDTKRRTQNALLMVALALRAYRLEHSSYPSSLSALVPNYLRELPDDPFALKEFFHYKRTQQGCTLYSVGPDGKDDGGRAIEDPGKKAQADRYNYDAGGLGDVVAGLNR